VILPIEKIWTKFENKYKAINIASLEARRLKEEQLKGLVDPNMQLIIEALKRLVSGKIRYKE